MNRILKDSLALFLITFISGLALGVVYNVTKEPIKKAEVRAEQEAYKRVLPEAVEFVEDEQLDVEEANRLIGEKLANTEMKKVLAGKDSSGNTVGYVMNVSNMAGYGGEINITVGILNDGTLKGYETLINNETAGLGQKAKEPAFSDQFKEKKVDFFEVVKSGKQQDYEIDSISGATITSKSVTNAVNGALIYFYAIGGGE